ncbi:NAD(P)/FAD-dependent oxidoreductase, partial [Salmonella enterica]|uniref:NAD(P)/FAD-dependent oxidoreductase n=1 Tax=Salmonella enterica TaxID=28901 RepID=UPI000A4DCD49
YVHPAAYFSQNFPFCKFALPRYTRWGFIDLVGREGIAWHEKTPGQLFCDDSAQRIVDMLVAECDKAGGKMRLRSEGLSVQRDESGFVRALNGEKAGSQK